jgi:hypothetical protein
VRRNGPDGAAGKVVQKIAPGVPGSSARRSIKKPARDSRTKTGRKMGRPARGRSAHATSPNERNPLPDSRLKNANKHGPDPRVGHIARCQQSGTPNRPGWQTDC